MNLIDLDMCATCGGSETRTVDVYKGDDLIATGDLCERCFGASLDGAARWRREFDALRDAGVDEPEANRIIIARMNADRDGKPAATTGDN